MARFVLSDLSHIYGNALMNWVLVIFIVLESHYPAVNKQPLNIKCMSFNCTGRSILLLLSEMGVIHPNNKSLTQFPDGAEYLMTWPF